MATTDSINIDAILNLKKVVADKDVLSGLNKILQEVGESSIGELIKGFEKSGYSRSVAATKTKNYINAVALSEFGTTKKQRKKGEELILNLREERGVQFGKQKLDINDSLKKAFDAYGISRESDDLNVKKKQLKVLEGEWSKLSYLDKKGVLDEDQKRKFRGITSQRGMLTSEVKKLEEINKSIKESPKKEAGEIFKAFARSNLIAAADVLKTKKDYEIPGAAWQSGLNAMSMASNPWVSGIAAALQVATLGIKRTYKKAEETYRGVTLYGPGYSSTAAETMAASKSGFTQSDYEKMADTGAMFGARASFGEISERQWTGLAFLPNYYKAIREGRSPEEQALALSRDRANAPDDFFFRQYMNMANVPESVLGWLNLAEKERMSVFDKGVKEKETRRRADAAAKIQGSVDDPSLFKGTAGLWGRLGIAVGDFLSNPGFHSITPLFGNGDNILGAFGEDRRNRLLARQAEHAAALTGEDKTTVVNVTLDVDGTTIFEGSKTQKEAIDSNYIFTGGAY